MLIQWALVSDILDRSFFTWIGFVLFSKNNYTVADEYEIKWTETLKFNIR